MGGTFFFEKPPMFEIFRDGYRNIQKHSLQIIPHILAKLGMIHEMMQHIDHAYAGTIRYQNVCVGKVRWFFIDPATIHVAVWLHGGSRWLTRLWRGSPNYRLHVPPIPESSTRTSSPFDPHLCCLNLHSLWLVVFRHPSEKWWTSSVGMMTFPIWWESHKSHVPNHQPDHHHIPIVVGL